MRPVYPRAGFRRPPSFHSFPGAVATGVLLAGSAAAFLAILVNIAG